MFFSDRKHAGKLLGEKMASYKKLPNALIIGLPRGGVITANEVAKQLELPLDMISLRKIGAPNHKELAIGAIADTGTAYYNHPLIASLHVSQIYLEDEVKNELALAKTRTALYRKGRAALDMKDKTIILVDDGLATGATMKAAIAAAKQQQAAQTIVAVPVAPPDTLLEIEPMVDQLICLYAPYHFSAVGQFYGQFEATSDKEVIEILSHYK